MSSTPTSGTPTSRTPTSSTGVTADEAMKQLMASIAKDGLKSRGAKRKRSARASKSKSRKRHGVHTGAETDSSSNMDNLTSASGDNDSAEPVSFTASWRDEDDALQIPEARKEAEAEGVNLAAFDTFVKRCFQQTDAVELMTAFCAEWGKHFVMDDDGAWFFYNASVGLWQKGITNNGHNTALVHLRNQFTDWGINTLSDTIEEYRGCKDVALRSLESGIFTTGLKRLSQKLHAFRNYNFGKKWSDLVSRAQVLLAQANFRSRLDADPMLRCFKNCVLDFRTGLVKEHDPTFLCSLQANHNYMTAKDVAHSPEHKSVFKAWQAHLSCVLANPAARNFHTDFQSYCMTGLNTLPWTMVCISTKAATNNNGKSFTMDVLKSFNGTYAVSIRAEALIEHRGPSQANAHTAEVNNVVNGPRIAFYSEVPDNATMNTMRFKQLTDQTMMIRRMYHGDETAACYAKLQGYVNMPLNFDRSMPEIAEPIDKRLSGCNFETQFFETAELVQRAKNAGVEHAHLANELLKQWFATPSALDAIGSFYCHNLMIMLDAAKIEHVKAKTSGDDNAGDGNDGSSLLRGYMNRKHGAFRNTWLQGYFSRIDFFEGFKLQLKFAESAEDRARVPGSEDVIIRALAIMKQTVDYVPQSAVWESTLRTRVINYWKKLHGRDRVDDFCKRNQGKRVLLLIPEPGSDFAESYTQALEEIEAERQPRLLVFKGSRFAGID